MSITTRVIKNSSLLLATSFINNLMMFLLTLFTARYLGTSNFGLISSAISLVGVFTVLCDLGLSTYAIQKVSRDYSLTKKYFGTTFILRIIFSVITFFIFMVFVYLSNFTYEGNMVMIVMGIYMVFNSITTFYYSLFQSNEKMHFQTITNTVYSVSVFLIALIFIYLNANVIYVASSYALASILSATTGLIFKIRNYPKFEYCFDKEFLLELFKKGVPFGITAVFTSIYFWIASICLTYLSGSVAVGLFSSSQRLLLVLAALYVLFSNSVFPIMSQLFTTDRDKLNDLYHKILKFMLMLGFPIVTGTLIFSEEIINLIYGAEFVPGAGCLRILIFASAFMFISGTCTTLLGAINKQLSVTKVAIIGAVFSVILNMVLIYKYSYTGASIATVLTEILMVIMMLIILERTDFKLDIRRCISPIIKVFISSVIMGVILYYLNLSLLISIPISVIVYLIALLVTGAINSEDREILLGTLKGVMNRQ